MTEKNTELPQNTPPTTQPGSSRPDNGPAGASTPEAAKPQASSPAGTRPQAAGAAAAKSDISNAAAAKPGASSPQASKTAARPAGTVPPGSPPARKKRGIAGSALLIALVVIVILAIALWYQHRQFGSVAAQLQQQAGASAAAAQQAGQQAQQALADTQRQAEQLAELRTALDASREQADGLQRAFQLITDSGSELVLLNDVDHLVTIAQQQLQLGGNVANAIISLETAQAQLARANRPGLASLQQTINGDLGKLRATSTIDVALLSSQLEEFGNLVSQAPLLVPDDAAPRPMRTPSGAAPAASAQTFDIAADAPWWRRAVHSVNVWTRETWSALGQDLGSFINVRRIDDASALLMSPDQATRFRENLRLRIMTAQLALMMRQPGIWESETDALLQAVERRYDPESAQTRQALKLARQFADTPIDTRLPTVDNSLRAIETLREERERSSQGDAAPAATHNGEGADGAQAPAGEGQAPDVQPDATPMPPSGEPAVPADSAPADSVPADDAAPGHTQPSGAQSAAASYLSLNQS